MKKKNILSLLLGGSSTSKNINQELEKTYMSFQNINLLENTIMASKVPFLENLSTNTFLGDFMQKIYDYSRHDFKHLLNHRINKREDRT